MLLLWKKKEYSGTHNHTFQSCTLKYCLSDLFLQQQCNLNQSCNDVKTKYWFLAYSMLPNKKLRLSFFIIYCSPSWNNLGLMVLWHCAEFTHDDKFVEHEIFTIKLTMGQRCLTIGSYIYTLLTEHRICDNLCIGHLCHME